MRHLRRFLRAGRALSPAVLLLLVALTVACGDDSEIVVQFTPAPATERAEPKAVSPAVTAPATPSVSMPIMLSAAEVSGLTAPDIRAAFEDLGSRTGDDLDGVEILRADRATWPDVSLGCPEPNASYAQIRIEGLWLVLSHQGAHYDYRVEGRTMVRCDDVRELPLARRPLRGIWTALAPMPTPRSEVAVVELDGLVYVFGGFGEGSNAAEAYDPATDSWRELAPMPTPINHAGAVTVGGLIYLVGGFDPRFQPIGNVTAYDPASDSWTAKADLPTIRGGLGTVVVDGAVLAIGGRGARGDVGTNERYDQVNDSWEARAPMPTGRDHVAAAVVDGAVYVIGGRLGSFARNLGSTEVYDPVSDTWSERSPLPTVRSGIGAATLDGKVYVFGGEEVEGTFDENERYDPTTDTWKTMPPMPTARHGLGVAAVGNRLYVMAGGTTPGGSASNINEAYIVLGDAGEAVRTAAPPPASSPIPTSTPAPAGPIPILGAGRIAYSDADGRIIVARPDGSSAVTVSPDDGLFGWPTWSPDGSELAFSGVRAEPDQLLLAMYAHRFADGSTRTVYTNERGSGPILPNMPHYPMWSPDGTQLSIMASHSTGLTIYVVDESPGDESDAVLRNAPLYASWSPDSTRMAVHGGLELFEVDLSGPTSETDGLGHADPGYRVPAWWPAGNRIAVVGRPDSGTRSLLTVDPDSRAVNVFVDVPVDAAFLWSPDGGLLAVAQSAVPGGVLYDGIALYDAEGELQSVGVTGTVYAFFWSPDGAKLAYVTPGAGATEILWNILDVTTGETWPLVQFIPSGPQITVFRFFDQFALSHNMWSPDSKALVFAGTMGQAVQASYGTQTGSDIIVSEVGPVPLAKPIAKGLFAVWSPR